MRNTVLFVGLALAAVFAFADLALKLRAALAQIEALGQTPLVVKAMQVRGPRPGVRAQAPLTAALGPKARRASAEHSLAALVEEGAPAPIETAAETDPRLAELLNDPDPAIGAAIRDFIAVADQAAAGGGPSAPAPR